MRKHPGIYRRGPVWWIDYRDQFGLRHREPVGRSQQQAVRARAMRLAEIESGKFGLRKPGKALTLGEFVEGPWRREVAIAFKPSTLRAYETALKHHLLPYFGGYPLPAITRAKVKAFIAKKAREQRFSYSKRNPNPNRPTLAPKTILNMVALLESIMEAAVADYELMETNPLRGVLRRKNFPADARRPRDKRVRFLEPEDFKRAVAELEDHPKVLMAVLFATLTGLRWGEQVALRIEEDVDFRRNRLRISRALYRRVPQTPKTKESVGDVDMCPTVRRILQAVPWAEGYVFSPDGQAPIGDGSWIKRQWRKAQIRAGIRRPISWHDLRHQFVTLLIAAGKHPKYMAKQARHASAGFTLDRYGDLFETIPATHVEWWDDLLWPEGCPYVKGTIWAQNDEARAETRVPSALQVVEAAGIEPAS